MKILVTGATGFVGRTLLQTLSGESLRVALRSAKADVTGCETVVVGDINGQTQWQDALRGVDCVVHLAARVHVMTPGAEDRRLFREMNIEGTEHLARSAALHGVKRFVFLSSVKVNGEETFDKPYCASDQPCPVDDYGISKSEAERCLSDIARKSNLEVFTIRPPLVYGPRVKANFGQLLSLVHSGIPMPFGCIRNKRSLVSVWNLCDLIHKATVSSLRGSYILMVSDGDDVSTAELVKRIGLAMGKPARLLPVPAGALKLLGSMTGKSAQISRLVGSLRVDISETRRLLQWEPPLSMSEGLERTAQWFMHENRKL